MPLDETSQHIVELFVSTFQLVSPAERKAAEDHLAKIGEQPGAISAVGALLSHNEVSPHVKQAIAIWLKNTVVQNYRKLHEGDRSFIQSRVLGWMMDSEQSVRVQMTTVLRTIADADFMENPMPIVNTILSTMPMDSPSRMAGSILALRTICKAYQYRSVERRQCLGEIAQVIFPLLLQIGQSLVAQDLNAIANHPDVELVGLLLVLIFKTFYSCTFLTLPDYVQVPENFANWASLVGHVLSMQIPQGTYSDIADPRNTLWKAKKWSANIVWRMLIRYGNPKTASKEYKPFSERFMSTYACSFLDVFLSIIAATVHHSIPPKIVNFALNYTAHALQLAITFKKIKPMLPQLLFEYCFPIICLNKEDFQLFEENPVEYIRRQNDIMDEYENPSKTAMNLFTEVCVLRGKDSLPLITGFINEHLRSSSQIHVVVGVLRVLIALCDVLKSAQLPYRNHLETMITSSIFPLFRSESPFLRSLACTVVEKYADVPWKNEQNPVIVAQYLVQLIGDNILPVRVSAGIALRPYIDKKMVAETVIKPLLPEVVAQYLKIIREIENDWLVNSLESIVEIFGPEVTPFAADLMKSLCASAQHMLEESQDENGSEDSVFAIQSCFSTMATLIGSVGTAFAESNKPVSQELFNAIDAIMVPFIASIFQSQYVDLLEDMVHLLVQLTFFAPSVSPAMWSLYPLMCDSFNTWAFDYLEEFLPIFDNYVSHGMDDFCLNDRPIRLLQVIQRSISSFYFRPNYENPDAPTHIPFEQLPQLMLKKLPIGTSERPLWHPCRLIEVVVQHVGSKLPEQIPTFLSLAVPLVISGARTVPLRILASNIVWDALHAVPEVSLNALTGMHAMDPLFNRLCARVLPHLTRAYDCKVAALGMLSLLKLMVTRSPAVPADWIATLDQRSAVILVWIIKVLKKVRDTQAEGENDNGRQRFRRANHNGDDGAGDIEDDDDDEEDDVGGFDLHGNDLQIYDVDDDTDAVSAEEAEYLEKLSQRIRFHNEKQEQLKEKKAQGQDADGDDDDAEETDDFNDLDDEDAIYYSVIDDIDEFMDFTEFLGQQNAFIQHLWGSGVLHHTATHFGLENLEASVAEIQREAAERKKAYDEEAQQQQQQQ
eukprot:ANDGO_06204.mRNA.1 Importin beta-like SAD2